MNFSLVKLQPIGRALMAPIAVLPIAGIMLRLGQPDLLDLAFIAASGQAIFSNLGLIFAVGIATGLAKDNHGAAALAGLITYLVATNGAALGISIAAPGAAGLTPSEMSLLLSSMRNAAIQTLSVPIGTVSGIMAGVIYNRFSGAKLPAYLAFFGGRRLPPILSGLAGLVLAALIGAGFNSLSNAVQGLSEWIVGSGGFALFLYGLLNRLLIITGLHHIINNVVWFILGHFGPVSGDLNRFFAGDPTAGAFMAGFFPVMMFGLPSACLAMYTCARPERRAEVGGLLGSMALTSFLTGITEPIEFTFMFVAPWLYGLHALLTGAAMVVLDMFGIRLGFSFSAGLFDYIINFRLATHPLYLLPIGLVFAAIYYVVFRAVILYFDIKTLGREARDDTSSLKLEDHERGKSFLRALGGEENILSVAACMSRLRLQVRDVGAVSKKGLEALGAMGTVSPGMGSYQVILGPIAEIVADEIRQASNLTDDIPAPQADKVSWTLAPAVIEALGGEGNFTDPQVRDFRLIVSVRDRSCVNLASLREAAPRGFSWTSEEILHVLLPRPAS